MLLKFVLIVWLIPLVKPKQIRSAFVTKVNEDYVGNTLIDDEFGHHIKIDNYVLKETDSYFSQKTSSIGDCKDHCYKSSKCQQFSVIRTAPVCADAGDDKRVCLIYDSYECRLSERSLLSVELEERKDGSFTFYSPVVSKTEKFAIEDHPNWYYDALNGIFYKHHLEETNWDNVHLLCQEEYHGIMPRLRTKEQLLGYERIASSKWTDYAIFTDLHSNLIMDDVSLIMANIEYDCNDGVHHNKDEVYNEVQFYLDATLDGKKEILKKLVENRKIHVGMQRSINFADKYGNGQGKICIIAEHRVRGDKPSWYCDSSNIQLFCQLDSTSMAKNKFE